MDADESGAELVGRRPADVITAFVTALLLAVLLAVIGFGVFWLLANLVIAFFEAITPTS